MARKTAALNPLFKWAVIVNGSICLLTVLVMCFAVAYSDSSVLAERLFGVCEKAFLMTTGAFIGLLGGRVAGPDSG